MKQIHFRSLWYFLMLNNHIFHDYWPETNVHASLRFLKYALFKNGYKTSGSSTERNYIILVYYSQQLT